MAQIPFVPNGAYHIKAGRKSFPSLAKRPPTSRKETVTRPNTHIADREWEPAGPHYLPDQYVVNITHTPEPLPGEWSVSAFMELYDQAYNRHLSMETTTEYNDTLRRHTNLSKIDKAICIGLGSLLTRDRDFRKRLWRFVCLMSHCLQIRIALADKLGHLTVQHRTLQVIIHTSKAQLTDLQLFRELWKFHQGESRAPLIFVPCPVEDHVFRRDVRTLDRQTFLFSADGDLTELEWALEAEYAPEMFVRFLPVPSDPGADDDGAIDDTGADDGSGEEASIAEEEQQPKQKKMKEMKKKRSGGKARERKERGDSSVGPFVPQEVEHSAADLSIAEMVERILREYGGDESDPANLVDLEDVHAMRSREPVTLSN